MREVSADYRSDFYDGIRVNGNQLEDLRYADDTALLSDSTSGIDNLIQSVKDHSEEKGLMLNVEKTKMMDIRSCKNSSNVVVNGENISEF